MPFNDDSCVRRHKHGDLSLDRISHQREARDADPCLQHLHAALHQGGIVQIRDRRDPIRATMLRSHVLRRLVSPRLAGKLPHAHTSGSIIQSINLFLQKFSEEQSIHFVDLICPHNLT